MDMNLTYALRGKRRWIGCECDGFNSRSELENHLQDLPVKLYDFEDGKCILVVRLEEYDSIRESLSKGSVVCVTSSGKIRLVRERMNFSRKPRKR